MKIVAQTRQSELIDRMNVAMNTAKYLDESTFEMRSIKRECERVRDVDAAQGWSLLACYYSMIGNREEVDRCFHASWRLSKRPVTSSNYYANISNLGYFSLAHEFFRENGRPELGMFSALAAKNTGSFQTLVSYFEEAEDKGIANMDAPNECYVKAARVLARIGFSDEDVARHMDAAGVVMRRHKLFYAEDLQVDVSDVDGVFVGVTCVFRVCLTQSEVFDLNIELAQAEREMNVLKNPAFDVVFLPA